MRRSSIFGSVRSSSGQGQGGWGVTAPAVRQLRPTSIPQKATRVHFPKDRPWQASCSPDSHPLCLVGSETRCGAHALQSLRNLQKVLWLRVWVGFTFCGPLGSDRRSARLERAHCSGLIGEVRAMNYPQRTN
jgi:hypothetical protein